MARYPIIFSNYCHIVTQIDKLKTKPSLGQNLLCIYNIKRFKDNIGGGLNFYRTGR